MPPLYNKISMQTYEIEIKSLLGNPAGADKIRKGMKEIDSSCEVKAKNKQLNHYFEGGSLHGLLDALGGKLSTEAKDRLSDLSQRAKSFSVRTRDKDGRVFLVVKASVGEDTSANGVTRMEFEEQLPLSLKQLDSLVVSAGFSYQAKWSREREEYVCNGVNVTLDKNAGYGWLAEFERIVDDATKLETARDEVRGLMIRLGVDELPQDRLERMFAYYNSHWPEYYGTDKIFVIE